MKLNSTGFPCGAENPSLYVPRILSWPLTWFPGEIKLAVWLPEYLPCSAFAARSHSWPRSRFAPE
jgi:hypothetical protein